MIIVLLELSRFCFFFTGNYFSFFTPGFTKELYISHKGKIPYIEIYEIP